LFGLLGVHAVNIISFVDSGLNGSVMEIAGGD
jgi:hypothetical protein